MRRALRWLGAMAAAAGLAFALTVFGVTLLAWRPPGERALPASAPMVIVLGAGMAANGELGSHTVRRMEHGLALVAAGRAERIHFSGGDVHRGITEGALMAETARARLPQAAISYEDRSHSTLQNAWFTVAALGAVPPGSLLVTDGVHQFRALASFLWAGAPALVPVSALALEDIAPQEQPGRILKEALAVWLNAARAAEFTLRRALGADPAEIAPILAGRRG